MTAPAFNEPFSYLYEELSLPATKLMTPYGCFTYQPTEHVDGTCIEVWQPAPELGAKQWTRGNKRILIGVFKDEGRAVQLKAQVQMQWSRDARRLVVYTNEDHNLRVGDDVMLSNINMVAGTYAVAEVPTARVFMVAVDDTGSTYGLGGWAPATPIDMASTNVVFRLLPSFKLVPIEVITNILNASWPSTIKQRVTLTDITSGSITKANDVISTSTISRLHRTQLNEMKRALPISYDAAGRPIIPQHRFKEQDNANMFISGYAVNAPEYVQAYDYYGFELNANRGPFFTNDIVTYDSSSVTGIGLKQNNNSAIYSGQIYDQFGDIVIGVTSNNRLVTRQPVQPLRFDQMLTPYQRPSRSITA